MQTASSPLKIALSVLIVSGLASCGTSQAPESNDDPATKTSAAESSAEPVTNPRDAAGNADRSAKLTVYSNPAGCMVFVDLVAVRSEGDTLALTPCEFTVAKGKHSISVERPGGRRATEEVDVSQSREFEFDVSSTASDYGDPSLLNAPFFEAAVGRSIPLTSLNSTERELDPFLSADGLTIYFSSDRGGNRGVYTATRRTPYHDFGEPAIVQASSGADLPVSPSVSGNDLNLVYAVAEKSRLWQLLRTDPAIQFGAKEIVRGDEKAERAWRSVQLSDDGLRLYWTEEAGDDEMLTRAAVRSAPGKLFGKTLSFTLPGFHPHLTSDGLRQFSFDGSKLYRSRRGSVKQPFGEPEVVAELELENYSHSPRHRQFWVTDDEQWIYYCDQPRGVADLYVMRISDGPGWGRTYIAKSVRDKMNVAAKPENEPKPEASPKETVDPRTLPFPYTEYWAKFVDVMNSGNGEDAVALVRQAQQKPEMQNDQKILAWDMELAKSLAEFNRDFMQNLQSMKPGTPIRVAGTRFEFDRLEEGVLHLKLKDKPLTKKISDLSPGERVSVADSGTEKGDAVKAMRFGVYLYFQGKAKQSIAEPWFKKAGNEGAQFSERLAGRLLHQAQGELARKNVGPGIEFLDAVVAAYPESNAAKIATNERGTLYDKLEWKPVGPRKWQRGEFGEFTADTTRSNNSYLTSDRKYSDLEFSCEWKVSGSTAMGGVFLHYSGNGKPLENAAKIHLANDADLKRMDRFATGAMFASQAPSMNASLAEGKWNKLRIRVRDKAVEAWINDKSVLQGSFGKDVPFEGFVMLDGGAGGISYRKVLLFDLPPTP